MNTQNSGHVRQWSVAFVVVNYQCSDKTVKLVDSLMRARREPWHSIHIVVVDNSPDDAEHARLMSTLPAGGRDGLAVSVVRSPENAGYFEGLNLGLARCAAIEKAFTVVGNADITVEHDFFISLEQARYPDDCFVVAPAISTPSGLSQNPYHLDQPPLWHRFLIWLYHLDYRIARVISFLKRLLRVDSSTRISRCASVCPIFMGHGSCYILTSRYFSYLNTLPRTVFLFGEEALLSEAVFLFGGRIYFDPAIRVLHEEHSTTAQVPPLELYRTAQRSYRAFRRYLHR